MTKLNLLLVILTLACMTARAQVPAVSGQADNEAHRIEIWFAVGKNSPDCKIFHLALKAGSWEIMSGDFIPFRPGVPLPAPTTGWPDKSDLDIRLECGKYHWHFSSVSERILAEDRWYVGIDYAPFHAPFENALWEHSLKTEPDIHGRFLLSTFCYPELRKIHTESCIE